MAPEKRVVEGPAMPKPLGPYSQAVQAGSLLFVSGQPGIDPATGAVAGPDFPAQARQAFANLERVLQAAGSDLSLVVKTTIYIADATAFADLNAIYAEVFPAAPPARAVPVVALPKGLLISVECVAVVG